MSNNPNRDRAQKNPFLCSTRFIMCIKFDRGDNMRTKISNRENCTYRDVKKYLQIQIQEKYFKEKLFQIVELILWHTACNERAISSQEWTASKNSNYWWLQSLCNTWDYLQGTRFRLLCDIFKYRQKQGMVGAFLKQTNKGLDISLRLGLSSFYACIKKKVKIHAISL